MTRHYTGIGARVTPGYVLELMTQIAKYKGDRNWCLRSGAARGADLAFQRGAKQKEIFLPWNNFNGFSVNMSGFFDASELPKYDEAEKIAEKYHPKWKRLSESARQMMSRNVYQVLGPDLNTVSSDIICWTEDRATFHTTSKTGGTGQALRIGIDYGATVHNLAWPDTYNIFKLLVNT